MDSRSQPTPHQPMPPAPFGQRPAAEAKRADVLVRVLIVNERDEEEKEAGYGHGV